MNNSEKSGEAMRFKPLVDKLFLWTVIPTAVLVLAATVIPALFYPKVLWIMLPCDLFIGYFVVSGLCGYVELRERAVFIRYGFFLRKEIPYDKIRALERGRGFYSTSMMALKNAVEHVDIKYNAFDVTTVSVIDNDHLIAEIESRRARRSD